jgi:hypothetical protein
MAQSRRWCFTLNNYTPAESAALTTLGQNGSTTYLVFGRETGASGTPHLQGFAIFATNQRLAAARLLIPRAHLEVARGTSLQAAAYCKKEADFEEFGTPPNQGKRNDFADFKEWVLEQPSKPTAARVAQEHPAIFIRYGRVMEWVDLVYPAPILVTGTPRAWQSNLAASLDGDADDRKIIFVVDQVGGCGKSWFVRWWLSRNGELTQVLSIGKRDDLAYAIDESKKYFFFDIPRSQSEFLQYSVFEKLKDRLVFSPKYGSRTKILTHVPFVVVFMNEEPDRNKLTHDRYRIINVRQL